MELESDPTCELNVLENQLTTDKNLKINTVGNVLECERQSSLEQLTNSNSIETFPKSDQKVKQNLAFKRKNITSKESQLQLGSKNTKEVAKMQRKVSYNTCLNRLARVKKREYAKISKRRSNRLKGQAAPSNNTSERSRNNSSNGEEQIVELEGANNETIAEVKIIQNIPVSEAPSYINPIITTKQYVVNCTYDETATDSVNSQLVKTEPENDITVMHIRPEAAPKIQKRSFSKRKSKKLLKSPIETTKNKASRSRLKPNPTDSSDLPLNENGNFLKIKRLKRRKKISSRITKKRKIDNNNINVTIFDSYEVPIIESKEKEIITQENNAVSETNNNDIIQTEFTPLPPEIIEVYICKICSKTFSHKLSLRGHMKQHSIAMYPRSKLERTLYPTIIENEKDITLLANYEDDKSSSNDNNDTDLQNSSSNNTSRKKYNCELCDRVFSHIVGLTGHKRCHFPRIKKSPDDLKSPEEAGSEASSDTHFLRCLHALEKPLSTRSRAGNFDEIIFSEECKEVPDDPPAWKKEVRIGVEYQATIPKRNNISEEDCRPVYHLWSPLYDSCQVEDYLKVSDSNAVKYGGTNREYALHLLFKSQGDILEALFLLIEGKCEIDKDNPIYKYQFTGLYPWTELEQEAFKDAWIHFGKEFSQIQQVVRTKNLNQVIDYYYRWTVECPDEYKKANKKSRSVTRTYLQTKTEDGELNEFTSQTEINDTIDNNMIEQSVMPNTLANIIVENADQVIMSDNDIRKPNTLRPKTLKDMVLNYQGRKEITSPEFASNKLPKPKTSSVSKKDKTINLKTSNISFCCPVKSCKCKYYQKQELDEHLQRHISTNSKTKNFKTLKLKKRFSSSSNVQFRTALEAFNPELIGLPKAQTALIAKKLADKAKRLKGIEGIPIVKTFGNARHRIINRVGVFPCKKCDRVFNRIKSLNAHMKYHSKLSNRPNPSSTLSTSLNSKSQIPIIQK